MIETKIETRMETKYVYNKTTKISYIKCTSSNTTNGQPNQSQNQPLILLHGNSQSNKLYKKAIPHLTARGFSVYAIDLRGHGKSTRVKLLNYTDMENDIYTVILHESLKNPILFGFSDGGLTALMFAISYPNTIKQLIVCGIRLSLKGIAGWIKVFWKVAYFFTRLPRLKLLLTQPPIDPITLKKISAPTTIVRAQHDTVKLSDSITASETIPNCRLIQLPKENHSSYVRNPKKLLALLNKILTDPSEVNN